MNDEAPSPAKRPGAGSVSRRLRPVPKNCQNFEGSISRSLPDRATDVAASGPVPDKILTLHKLDLYIIEFQHD
ncbi:hypothetical protein EVAR_35580_1 [Eumeta japonica]|uniref:Uncharacterized protein n=1 Tax=Eumeta variegata TaxID=151549 RepID=A0A4C1XK83_EUMVA|nr:hypothetical protein EVAR_35580_1 [Eumeta japonica]